MTPGRLIVITGPTASGKSRLALQTARRLGGEIVSVDSMQIYRHLEIGTAQPTPEERREVPHHLVGEYEFDVRLNVYDYTELARRAIESIWHRNRVAVAAGGTGFYLKALLYGLDDLPGDNDLRKRLDNEYDRPEMEEALHRRLLELDPRAAEQFRQCRRRMIRALEVHLITGKSILDLRQGIKTPPRYPHAEVYRLDLPPETLKERIAQRCDKMLADGWIAEAEAALKLGLLESPTARQALGYRQIADYLAGKYGMSELRKRIAAATWQFARRQRTWFAHQHPEAKVLTAASENDLQSEGNRCIL